MAGLYACSGFSQCTVLSRLTPESSLRTNLVPSGGLRGTGFPGDASHARVPLQQSSRRAAPTRGMATGRGRRGQKQAKQDIFRVEISPDASDAGRSLHEIADIINDGGVGIVPTDTVYAIVCDLTNRAAVEKLYRIKQLDPKKPLSILCRTFQDVDTYTLGFPRGNSQGQTNVFRAVRQCLPGPYTFVLRASKEMPKQCTTFGGSAVAHCAPRKSVGVRMPDDAICQTLLQMLDRPLLCTSATEDGKSVNWLVDPAVIGSTFTSSDGSEHVDFVVDGGARVAQPSTVVDMTGERPVVLRQGKGEVEDWMLMETHDSSDTIPSMLGGKVNPYATA